MKTTLDCNRDVLSFLQKVKHATTSALLLDYDGTLAPFAVDRNSALPYPGVQSLLQEICDGGRTRIIIVTGRSGSEIEPLLGIHPGPEVWGSHGLQRLRPNGASEMPKLGRRLSRALANAERWLAYQGLHDRAEPKPGGLAVHWRGLDEGSASALRDKVFLGWSALTRNYPFSIVEFDGGVELRVANYDTGSAVRTILEEIGPETPIAYLGDDRTDEPAFRALRNRGLTVLVRQNPRHSQAQVWLRPPDELVEFLRLWCDATRGSAGDSDVYSPATFEGRALHLRSNASR